MTAVATRYALPTAPLPTLPPVTARAVAARFPDRSSAFTVAGTTYRRTGPGFQPLYLAGLAIPMEAAPEQAVRVGRSFTQAVAVAHQRAVESARHSWSHASQAVMMARGGVYYVLPTFDDEGGSVSLNEPGLGGGVAVRAHRVSAEVKAVVDTRAWVNFEHRPLRRGE